VKRPLIACVLLLALAAGCLGRGAIFLTIEARGPDGILRIPEDVDRLHITATNAATGEGLLDKDYGLDAATHRFPVTLALEQGAKTGTRVKLEVKAWLQDTEVGKASATIPVVAEEITEVTLRIDKF
jgi:hypothetical protein